jgi:hypothetical protein
MSRTMPKPPPSLQQRITSAVKRDPKRSGVLAVLLVVLAVVAGRTLTRTQPRPVLAAAQNPKAGTVSHAREARPPVKKDTYLAMRHWLAAPAEKVNRNLFAARIEDYPQLSGRKSRNGANGAKGLSEEEKSARQSADEAKERQSLTEAMHLEARQLVLTSTVIGTSPKALINGQMVKEGDVVASGAGESPNGDPGAGFRVLRIEARRVIIEREGIKLEILMK